ncbi:MAG: glycoside hydrolase family 20 protein [Bacteroidales bacterium]|nr:glycoside hydrolase family 20 protein [Bacteroidales bacterium]
MIFVPMNMMAIEPGGIKGPSVIPKPVKMKLLRGNFILDQDTRLIIAGNNQEVSHISGLFSDCAKNAGCPLLPDKTGEKPVKGTKVVIFTLKDTGKGTNPESYELQVTPKQILVRAGTAQGLFYGMQTLLQLMPADFFVPDQADHSKSYTIPCIAIKDQPRYSYRGMHLDVSRHFFPKDFIKRYIDLIAQYKMNTFHWHLTDDHGWRIEIKKYPKLTEIAAWRVDHEDLPWNGRPAQKPGEKATYGGYYTQDDIREIVKYAADRYVTIIPEIEMPAHSVEVLAAYPRLSCKGGPFTVPSGSYWPDLDIFCAGNDSVFTFLQDVLTEVMELFPSQYIHIGGDEADKANWKQCPKCQARIKSEGLKDENELQSYFIKRIEKFIVSRGRKVIGWDEILEGGLPPEATVMSWRGVEGGIAAARQGHDAIMTPGSFCYFDHYQADPRFEPKAIGGFTTLKKVYSYNPTPGELNPEEAKHILGAQGNVWAEFIPTPSQAEYMAVPRMIALAEVLWSPEKSRTWDDFRSRMATQYQRLDDMKVNYSKGSFRAEINTITDKKTNVTRVALGSEQWDVPIHYTINGDDVKATSPLYTGPFEIKRNGIIRAGLFVDGKLKETTTDIPFLFHLAIGKPLKYLSGYSYRYPASGPGALVDGLRGSISHRDGMWQGFLGNDLEIIIDLGKEVPVNTVQMNFLQNQRSWIFLPVLVEYSLSSDGKRYHSINEVPNAIPPKEEQTFIQPFNIQFMPDTKARYVKVKAKNLGKCPSWHEGSGQDCWMFTDEIVVY